MRHRVRSNLHHRLNVAFVNFFHGLDSFHSLKALNVGRRYWRRRQRRSVLLLIGFARASAPLTSWMVGALLHGPSKVRSTAGEAVSMIIGLAVDIKDCGSSHARQISLDLVPKAKKRSCASGKMPRTC